MGAASCYKKRGDSEGAGALGGEMIGLRRQDRPVGWRGSAIRLLIHLIALFGAGSIACKEHVDDDSGLWLVAKRRLALCSTAYIGPEGAL
jgi:hypothetical protein